MKALVSALALLVGSNIVAMAGDQTLKFKLVTFYLGEKDGESHMVGATVSPDGTTSGPRTSSTNRAKTARQPDIARIISPTDPLSRTIPRRARERLPVAILSSKYQIVSGTGAYQGATGGGSIDGDWGDKSPLKNASLFNIELDVKTPGM